MDKIDEKIDKYLVNESRPFITSKLEGDTIKVYVGKQKKLAAVQKLSNKGKNVRWGDKINWEKGLTDKEKANTLEYLSNYIRGEK